MFTDRAHWHQGDGVLPEEAIERICSELGFGRWTMRFAIHGDEAIVDHKFAKVQEAFGRIEGATVVGTKYAGSDVHTIENAERVQAGIPNLELVQMGKWYGGESGGHRLLARRAAHLGGRAPAARPVAPRPRGARVDYSAALIPTGPRSFINVVLVVFDTSDEERTRAAFEVSKASCRRRRTSATASTARTSTSWTCARRRTTSTTPQADASRRRSRTRSTRTGS